MALLDTAQAAWRRYERTAWIGLALAAALCCFQAYMSTAGGPWAWLVFMYGDAVFTGWLLHRVFWTFRKGRAPIVMPCPSLECSWRAVSIDPLTAREKAVAHLRTHGFTVDDDQ